MPNIIEQQDLLKGLPDARLMTLLQKPVGDIPPFLVAAEAQRRQQIRQQFAGSGSKESVVDTLTKQLAGVPQNIGSKGSPTESPDLKGLLEKSEETQSGISSQQGGESEQQMARGGVVRRFAEGGIASLAPKGTYYGFSPGAPTMTALGTLARAASQANPQQQAMRNGGMVQRYQSQGLVTPTVDSLAANIAGMSLEEYKRKIEKERIEKLGPGKARYLLENPTLPTSEAEKAEREFYAATEGPFSGFYSPESAYAAAQEAEKQAARSNRIFPTLPPGASGGMSFNSAQPKGGPQGGPEAAAEMQPKEGETPDEYRARLEKLLAAQDPSGWENAQKYFAMAQQFLDPSKTTMESLVGAGQAFSQSAGEQARAQREAKLALEKGMLEYDIAERNRIREVEAERENRKYETEQKILERRNPPAADVLDSIDAMIRDLNENIAKMKDPVSGSTPEDIKAAEELKQAYIIQRANILKAAGYGPANGVLTVEDLYKAVGK